MLPFNMESDVQELEPEPFKCPTCKTHPLVELWKRKRGEFLAEPIVDIPQFLSQFNEKHMRDRIRLQEQVDILFKYLLPQCNNCKRMDEPNVPVCKKRRNESADGTSSIPEVYIVDDNGSHVPSEERESQNSTQLNRFSGETDQPRCSERHPEDTTVPSRSVQEVYSTDDDPVSIQRREVQNSTQPVGLSLDIRETTQQPLSISPVNLISSQDTNSSPGTPQSSRLTYLIEDSPGIFFQAIKDGIPLSPKELLKFQRDAIKRRTSHKKYSHFYKCICKACKANKRVFSGDKDAIIDHFLQQDRIRIHCVMCEKDYKNIRNFRYHFFNGQCYRQNSIN